jgi:hypothetical protein
MSPNRLAFATLLGLLGIFPVASAQDRASTQPPAATAAPRLSEAQMDRLYGRLMGTWRLNMEKSFFFTEKPPQLPYGYTYQRVGANGVRFTSSDGESVQYYDGKQYPLADHGRTVMRVPIDEFTVDNVITTNGKRSSQRTQYLSGDGKVMLSLSKVTNERGEEVPASFRILEKVPEGTPVFVPKAKP